MEHCPFCTPDREAVFSSDHGFAIFDRYPVTDGHMLVIPRRHVAGYFQLSGEEKADLWNLVERVREYLREKFGPDGFNIGFNENRAAGQTIFHVHIHVIPRYEGDVEDPAGGIRNVIPGKGRYGEDSMDA